MIRSRAGHWASFILRCLAFVLLVGCRPSQDAAWRRVRETGILRVGMDASLPPFETLAADGTLIGFDVDLARQVGRRLGVEVQFVPNLPYDGLYDALRVGRVDAVISALVVNAARTADFAYSAPYFDAGQVLVVREAETDVGERPPETRARRRSPRPLEGTADLSGRTLAVEFGTQGDLMARKWERRLRDLTVVRCETAAEALDALGVGDADAALVDRVSALGAMGWGSELAVAGDAITEEPYAVAVRGQNRRLLRAINEALAEMEADGTVRALVERWMMARGEGHG